MTVAAVDIGTNSVRLLVLDETGRELERIVKVVGLGRGVDRSGSLSEDAMDRTVEVLGEFGRRTRLLDASRVRVVATSASRDAANSELFLDRAETALGVRPEVISGVEEARLTFAGAVGSVEDAGPYVVIDIGGGSTEFAFGDTGVDYSRSVDIGSVRLTERAVRSRPAPERVVDEGRAIVDRLFEDVHLPSSPNSVIGVGGTFTSLAAIVLGLEQYDRSRVHLARLHAPDLASVIDRLRRLSIPETAAIPALDPARAPVLLAGAIVAERALARVGVDSLVISEHDLLDAAAESLLPEP